MESSTEEQEGMSMLDMRIKHLEGILENNRLSVARYKSGVIYHTNFGKSIERDIEALQAQQPESIGS